MTELRGITVDYPNNIRRVKLTIRSGKGDQYETIEYPQDQPLNRGLILVFIGDYYDMEPGHIVWPDFLEIPTE